MTATYNPSLPTARDRVRLAIGDTAFADSDDGVELLQDETYDAELLKFGEEEATARLAEGLATRYGQMPSSVTIVGDLVVNWADRVKAWLELAARMRKVGQDAVAAAGSEVHVQRVQRPYETEHAEYVRDREPWWTG